MIEHQHEWPRVSVLAPCRNEASFIQTAIQSILDNDYPADKIEVLVLDGMSTDGTREIVQQMIIRDSRIKLVDNPDKIVPTAMNIGIRAAQGEYIIRIDCHAKFSNDYIRRCIEVHRRTKANNVGGYSVTLPGANTPMARAIASVASCRFGVGNSQFRLTGPEQQVDTVPFGTYKKEMLEKIGGYDERLVRNQDIELNSRIRKAGGTIIISPEIKLCYYNRATLKGLWQQSFNNGLWNPYTVWLVGGGLSLRHFIPMVFVLGIAVLLAGSVLWSAMFWLLLGYLSLYSFFAAIFAIQTTQQNKVNIPNVWICFWVLHIAYGIGSLWAVLTIPFKFPSRKKKQIGKALADRKK